MHNEINKAFTPGSGRVINITDQAATGAMAGVPVPGGARADAYAAAWGANGLFSPGIPNTPVYDEDDGARVFDYQPGVNYYITPRMGYGLLPFSVLRQFADYCEEVRIVIEAFKREIRSLEWDINKADPADKTDYGPERTRLKAFWARPDGATEFDSWLNAVLEDMLVVDAATLWLEGGNAGEIRAVQQIDGATIRPLLDVRGRIPQAPAPGYMQAIKGMNWTWFTSEFLMYRPFNGNIHSPYGKSPTEFILTTINTSLQRKLSQAVYWNQTNVPEALVGVPDTWDMEQVKALQEWFDTLLSGNVDKLRRLKFMPVSGSGMPVHEFRRPDGTTVYDEWVLKMASWAFGFLPSEFGIVNGAGLGGKGFLEGQENTMYRFGVGPVIQYVQNIITTIISRQTTAPLCFRFINIGPAEDKAIEADLDERQLRNGIIDINVLRAKAGQPPIAGAKPFILVGNEPILLDDLFAPKPPPPPTVIMRPPVRIGPGEDDEEDDTTDTADTVIDGAVLKMSMDQWREKCRRRRRDSKSIVCDPPAMAAPYIPVDIQGLVKAALGGGDIDQAFSDGTLAQLVKKKPLTPQAKHANATRDALEADMATAIARAFSRLGRRTELKPASADEAGHIAAGAGEFWEAWRDELGGLLINLLTRGVEIGIDEARNDPMFRVEKLAKADDTPESPMAAVGIDWVLVNTDAAAWARVHAAGLVREMQATTLERMHAAVYAFINDGQTIPYLARVLTGLVNDPKRAQLIAQTESTRSFAQGNTLAWKAQGIEGRRWFSVEDSRVCPVCGGLAGSRAKLGEPFKTKDGGVIDNPPAHPGCRCYIQPVEIMPTAKPTPTPAPVSVAPAGTVLKPKAPAIVNDAPAVPGQIGPGDGPTVGSALTVGRGKVAGKIRDAIKVIDSVHSDGDLIPIDILTKSLGDNTHGAYNFKDGKGKPAPISIEIAVGGPRPEITAVHEIGHYLDNVALSDGHESLFGSTSPAAKDFMTAVNQSRLSQSLRLQKSRKTVEQTLKDGTTVTVPTHRNYIDYLLKPEEMFARAYAQYIATRSGNPAMLQQLAEMRDNPYNPYKTQWTDEDFAPIAAELDKWFKLKGWVK